MRFSMAGRASSPRRTELASSVRVSASARARAACLVRRAAMSTTGLGLAIVAAIVAEHGGKVDLDTAVGQGCQVTVSLPLATTGATGR